VIIRYIFKTFLFLCISYVKSIRSQKSLQKASNKESFGNPNAVSGETGKLKAKIIKMYTESDPLDKLPQYLENLKLVLKII